MRDVPSAANREISIDVVSDAKGLSGNRTRVNAFMFHGIIGSETGHCHGVEIPIAVRTGSFLAQHAKFLLGGSEGLPRFHFPGNGSGLAEPVETNF
jgi:hypothetical protein